ncbi:MAG: hypothetical protein KIC54_01600 [Clostridium sp.]|nr:hypothetical protein [Clostridium sp.]
MPKRKIEPSEYPNILELYESGLAPEQIAKKYHVGRTSILYILNKYYPKEFEEIRLRDRNVKVFFVKKSSPKIAIPKLFFSKINVDENNPKVQVHLNEKDKTIILKKPIENDV